MSATAFDPLAQFRARASEMIADNALAMDASPNSGFSGDRFDQIAMNGLQKGVIKGLMHASGSDGGFDRTIGRMTGGTFTSAEIEALKDRSLDRLDFGDAIKLKGVAEGPPVTFSPQQKAIVDRMMTRLGDDPLARRAREAYGKAQMGGQVRAR